MFALKVGNKYLGIPTGQTFTLVKNSELFSTDLPEGEHSYPINLNLKDKNVSDFFGSLRNIQSVKNFKSIDCQIYFRKQPLENNARLVFRRRKGNIIQGYVLSGSSLFAQALKNTKINEIDYGSYDTGDGQQDMVDHMLDTVNNPQNYNHVFAEISAPNFKSSFNEAEEYSGKINLFNSNTGAFLPNNTLGSLIHRTAYVPFLKLDFVLKRILQHFGFTLNWSLLNENDFKKIILVNNTELAEYFEKLGCKVRSINQSFTGDGLPNMTDIYEEDGSTIVKRLPLGTDFIEFDENISAEDFEDTLSFNLGGNFHLIESDDRDFTIKLYTEFDHVFWGSLDILIFEVWIETNVTDEFESVLSLEYNIQPGANKQIVEDEILINIPSGSIGKKMKFKISTSWYEPWSVDVINLTGQVWRPLNTTFDFVDISIIEPPRTEVKNLIEYHQHLNDDNCSEFLNSIRKRFGAYVSNIDFQTKIITFKQLKSVAKNSSSKSIFKNRAVVDELETSFHRYIFENEYDDEPLIKTEFLTNINFKEITKGSEIEDAEDEKISLKYAPILENIFKTPTVGFDGKIADDSPASLRMAIYHGMQNSLLGGNPSPFVSNGHTDRQNNILTFFNLRLDGPHSLWEVFWKDWYQKLFLQEKYKFEIIPEITEIKNFKFDAIDFYQFALFVCEKVEFKLQNDKILKSKFEVVKLNR